MTDSLREYYLGDLLSVVGHDHDARTTAFEHNGRAIIYLDDTLSAGLCRFRSWDIRLHSQGERRSVFRDGSVREPGRMAGVGAVDGACYSYSTAVRDGIGTVSWAAAVVGLDGERGID